jgi:hypothetical protein
MVAVVGVKHAPVITGLRQVVRGNSIDNVVLFGDIGGSLRGHGLVDLLREPKGPREPHRENSECRSNDIKMSQVDKTLWWCYASAVKGPDENAVFNAEETKILT